MMSVCNGEFFFFFGGGGGEWGLLLEGEARVKNPTKFFFLCLICNNVAHACISQYYENEINIV